MISRRRGKRDSLLSMDSLADIVSNSLGMIIIIMVSVTILVLFRENFSGNTSAETGVSDSMVKMSPPDSKDMLPYSRIADSYKRPVTVIACNGKIYRVRLDKFYLRIYSSLMSGALEETFTIDDVVFKLMYRSDSNSLLNAQYSPEKDGGFLVNESTDDQTISRIIGVSESVNGEEPVSPLHQYFQLIVYPDSFKVYRRVKELLTKNKFNFNVQVFEDTTHSISLTRGIFTTDWSNWRIQE